MIQQYLLSTKEKIKEKFSELLKNPKIIVFSMLLLVLVIISYFLFLFNQYSGHTISFFKPAPTPITARLLSATPTSVPKTAILSLKQLSPTQIAVIVDTQGKPITGVQIALSFDPGIIQNISLEPGTFFVNPVILENKVQDDGTLIFSNAIGPTDSEQTGKGTVAILTFTPSLGVAAKTTINFLPQTAITTEGAEESVLKNSTGITIPL